MFIRDTEELGQVIPHLLTHAPESFESYDHHTLGLVIKYFPEFAAHFGIKNFARLGVSFLPEMAMVLTGGMPHLVLMAEFTGDTDAEALAKAQAAQDNIQSYQLRSRITASTFETSKYWLIRRESFNLLRHHLRRKHTAPFIDDIVVAPAKLPEFLPELNRLMSQYNLVYTVAGHIGDGNFHIIPLMDFEDPRTKEIIPRLSRQVFELVFRYGGSMSGEHNDGLIRSPYLRQMYGPKIYRLFEEVKEIFDPHNIFNPGKKVHATIAESMTHFAKY
jgi:FAD/FMN-containing dehydrogenase